VPGWSLLQPSGIHLAGTYPARGAVHGASTGTLEANPGVRDGVLATASAGLAAASSLPTVPVLDASGTATLRKLTCSVHSASVGQNTARLGPLRRELALPNAFFPVLLTCVDTQRLVLRIRVGRLRPN
jgi:hypothetical protein